MSLAFNEGCQASPCAQSTAKRRRVVADEARKLCRSQRLGQERQFYSKGNRKSSEGFREGSHVISFLKVSLASLAVGEKVSIMFRWPFLSSRPEVRVVWTKVLAGMVVSRGVHRFQFAGGQTGLSDGPDGVAKGSTG